MWRQIHSRQLATTSSCWWSCRGLGASRNLTDLARERSWPAAILTAVRSSIESPKESTFLRGVPTAFCSWCSSCAKAAAFQQSGSPGKKRSKAERADTTRTVLLSTSIMAGKNLETHSSTHPVCALVMISTVPNCDADVMSRVVAFSSSANPRCREKGGVQWRRERGVSP